MLKRKRFRFSFSLAAYSLSIGVITASIKPQLQVGLPDLCHSGRSGAKYRNLQTMSRDI